jgi:hypothetical protein
MSLQTLAEQIRDTATSHIIEDLVDINFGENEPAPRLVFDEIGSRQAATALALKTLVDAGVIRPDEVLEESSRQQYGLPPADPSTVRTPPAPTGPQDVMQPPTQTGDLSTAVAAAGPAHTPAGEKGAHQLHEYWTHGEGLAKWADSPTPWTTLHEHLLKFMPDLEARATAAAWYHDVFGSWPGNHDGHHGVKAKFNPSEPRVPGGEHGGEWGSGGAGGALKDTLKLAGRIQLGKDEKLVGSAKIDGDGGIRMALTETHGVKSLRLGLGGEMYGKANRDEGIPAWDGNPPHVLPEADRKRLDAEHDALDHEYDTATPARQSEIQARMEAIREQLTAGDGEFNGTAKLDQYSMGRLADKIRPALAEAVDQLKAENKAWDELEALLAKGDADPARVAELRQKTRSVPGSPGYDGIVFDKGIIPGSEWGDVHYSVELDDPTQGVTVRLGVQPKNTPDDWGDGKDWQGHFDAAETTKFLRLLDKYGA